MPELRDLQASWSAAPPLPVLVASWLGYEDRDARSEFRIESREQAELIAAMSGHRLVKWVEPTPQG